MKKRILSFLLSLLMVVSLVPVGVFAEGEKLTISAEEVEVEYGTKTVSVNILLSNNPGVAGLKFGVSYDKSALTLVGANKESTEVDLFATLNKDYSKYPYIVTFFADSNDTSEGILFTMDFEISKDAQPGTYNIDVAVAKPGDIINEDSKDIPCVTQSGSVTLTAEEMNSAVVLNDKAVTYDGNVHTLSLANTSKLPEDYSVVYTCDGQPFEGAKDAGTYNVEAFVKAFGCYDKTFEAVLTINPKKLTYTKGVVAQRVYDGTTDVTYSTEGKVTGIVAGDDVVCEVTSQMASANAGTGIKVNVSFNLTGEDKDNYLVPNAPSLTGTITKRAVTVTANGSKLEGAADPVLEPEFISGSLVEGDEFTGAVEREAGEEPKNYAVKKGSLALDLKNYTLIFRQGTFTIHPKSEQDNIKVEGVPEEELTYGDNGFTVVVNTTDEKELLGEVTIVSSDENVLAVDGKNVTVKNAGTATLTVTAEGNDNYYDFVKEYPLTVNKKALTINVEDNSKIIDSQDPELTYTADNAVNGDVLEITRVYREQGEEVGTYIIDVEYTLTNADNYIVTVNKGTFVIADKFEQKNVAITGIPETALTYGDNGFTVVVDTTDEKELLGEVTVESSDENVLAVDGNNVTVKNAGKATLTVTAKGNAYYHDYEKNYTITVNKRTIKVEPVYTSKYVGETEDPVIGHKIVEGSLVDGDAFTGALTRTSGSTVRAYDVKIGDFSAGSNYVVTLVNYAGKFEILKKRTQQIELVCGTSFVYGDTAAKFELKYAKGDDYNKDAISYAVSSNENVATIGENNAIVIKNVGRTTITVTMAGNYMYEEWKKPVTITVTKRPITLTAEDAFKKKGNDDPAKFNVIIDGEAAYDDVLEVTAERVAGEEVGKYDINVNYTLTNSHNYQVTVKKGVFEILEKTPQILTVADIGAVNYRDEPLVLDIASNMNGAVITYTVDNEAVIAHKDGNTFEIKGVGEAVITAKADGNEEYADATKEIPVKVEPKKVTVSVASNDNTIYYGDVFNYDIEYNGFVKGETKAVLEAQAVLNCGKLTAGSHNLTPEGAAAKNYTFEYIPFNLTVKPAEIALHNNDISFYNMQYTADMDNKVEVINFNLYPVHGAILEGDDIEFVVQAQTKTAITMADTYFVQFIITAEGDDAGNYLMVNEGKYGFGDDNSFTVEVLDGSYTAEHLKAQIETLLSKLSLDGADTAIAFPEIPEGFEITLKSPVMSGETALIDTNGKRTGDGEGEFDVVYVITDTVGDTTAEVTTKIEVAALEKFSVTVLTQNGTVAGEGEYTVVDSITLTATPNAGYSFVDWKIGGTQVSTNTEFTFKLADYLDKGKDLELTATFKTAGGGGGGGGGGGSQKPVYVVDFYNGETKHTFKMVEKGSTVDKPEDPAKEGFTFEGWFTDKEFTKPYDFSAQVTASIELYAKFAEIKQEGDDNGEEKEEESKWTNTFNDVKEDDWYYEYVEYAVTKGLFNGMSEEEFGPNVSLSRAMLVTVLFRAEEEPEIALNGDFTDVGEGEYFSEAVAWAQQNGIVNGISATEFAPNAVITREQFATIMHRYAMFKKYDVGVGEETNILSYDDYDNISEYAIAAIQYTAGSGLMKGRSESTINPKDSATRAEAATILARFFEMYKD